MHEQGHSIQIYQICDKNKENGHETAFNMLDFRSGGWWFEPSLCRHVVLSDKKLYFKRV